MEVRGKTNVYSCRSGHQTITINADSGTTPFMIACQASGCTEAANSGFYPSWAEVLDATHEWFEPTKKQVNRMAKKIPGLAQYCENGGLLLREISTGRVCQ